MTCHKTQGGQWQRVFIDGFHWQANNLSYESLRWMYTALTRATEKVFLINLDDKFFLSGENH
jgi:exodeoxyribonuclease-5